jgi:glucose/arabinose dehydrogenase
MLAGVRTRLPAVAAALVLLSGCSADGGDQRDAAPRAGQSAAAPTGDTDVALDVEVVADGFDHAWDVAQASDGTLLVDQRPGGLTAVLPDGTVREVDADFGDLFAQGETGLMGLALDPDFDRSRRFYTCQGRQEAAGSSIAVVAWEMTEDWSAAERVADPLLGDIPVNQGSGRHGGCRLRFAPDGFLLVGTGDNAHGSNPQDLGSLAGKVLRIDPATGRPAPGNPFADRDEPEAAYIWTYGHRNVQGLAVRPGTDQVFSAEHGPDRDDEINLLRPGGNYGWDPDGAGGYDESVPMTDPDIEGAVPAVWSSGDPTLATSGATFLDGEQWGDLDGVLVVGLLKDTGVLALRLDDDGALVEAFQLAELDGTHGRIRTVQLGTDGALYATTDNGGDDALLRVTPRR